jgi:hypothetical protein
MDSPDGTVVTIDPSDEHRAEEICALLVRSFWHLSPTWVPTIEAAREVILDALQPWMLSRACIVGAVWLAGWERGMTMARCGNCIRSSWTKRCVEKVRTCVGERHREVGVSQGGTDATAWDERRSGPDEPHR